MIVASELRKQFQSSGRTVRAVDGVSFEIAPGEVYGLLGPNGAGKTTTLRMVMGLLQPDSGYAEIDGARTGPDSASVRKKIGSVSSNDGIYPWLSVREMLLYFADLFEVEPERARERLSYLVKVLGISDYVDQRCATLSTGQRQRVGLARGLIHDPPVILLDEPTRGLDVVGSKVIFDFIDHVRDEGKAVLVSTHRLEEAERICDRFGLLYRGKLRHEGSMSSLQQQTGKEHLVDMFLAMIAQEAESGAVNPADPVQVPS